MNFVLQIWRVGVALLVNHRDINMDARVYFQLTVNYNQRHFGMLWWQTGIQRQRGERGEFLWVHP